MAVIAPPVFQVPADRLLPYLPAAQEDVKRMTVDEHFPLIEEYYKVDMYKHGRLGNLIASINVGWHDDVHGLNRWNALFVLRGHDDARLEVREYNKKLSIYENHSVSLRPGSFVIFNSHLEHRLVGNRRLWIALACEAPKAEQRPSVKWFEQQFHTRLTRVA